MTDAQLSEYLELMRGLTAMSAGQVAVLGEWTFQDIARQAYATIERLQSRLDQINALACYASEENTTARSDALLEIGKLARGEWVREWPTI